MTEIGITRMSSKGQIVIPREMRDNMKVGEKLFIIEGDGRLIIKKASKIDEQFQEDLEFARRTEKAYQEIESGKSKRVKLEDLDRVMDNW